MGDVDKVGELDCDREGVIEVEELGEVDGSATKLYEIE